MHLPGARRVTACDRALPERIDSSELQLALTGCLMQFADIFFTPVVARYHLTRTDHIALSVQICTPTCAYNTDRLANAG
ncbi:hypothetical protein P3T22_005645 [Paraburkholderia sp. GAS348]